MSSSTVRTRDKDTLAQFLGWLSLTLGIAGAAAPKAMCNLVGARGEGRSRAVMRVVGLRELMQGVAILTRPRPTAWLWSRVAGDAVDLALLALTAARGRGRKRSLFAFGNVLVVTVPDVLESRYLSGKRGAPSSAMRIRKAVTINRSRSDVESAWGDAHELRRKVDAAGASVAFETAPGDRGTELAVEIRYDPPAGDLGAAVQKLTGRDLPTQLADDLRRFKQQVETGEVVRSDATPSGHLLVDHLKQRPARPVEEVRS